MSKVVSIESRKMIEDQASLWIVKMERGLTHSERTELKEWAMSDEKHKQALQEMAITWDKTESLAALKSATPCKQNVSPDHKTTTLGSYRSLAAVLVLCLVTVIFTAGLYRFNTHLETVEFSQVYETGIGAKSTHPLPDGSILHVNTGSIVKVDYTDKFRTVTLTSGEIGIDVAKDKSRPLIVRAGKRYFRAVGTIFNVEVKGTDEIELIVTEGLVAVGDVKSDKQRNNINGEFAMVSQGQKLYISKHHTTINKLAPDEINALLSWKDGLLVFSGETLEEATKEITRYTGTSFIFIEDDIRKIRVAGIYRTNGLDELIDTIESNFGIEAKVGGNQTVYLRKKREN